MAKRRKERARPAFRITAAKEPGCLAEVDRPSSVEIEPTGRCIRRTGVGDHEEVRSFRCGRTSDQLLFGESERAVRRVGLIVATGVGEKLLEFRTGQPSRTDIH